MVTLSPFVADAITRLMSYEFTGQQIELMTGAIVLVVVLFAFAIRIRASVKSGNRFDDRTKYQS